MLDFSLDNQFAIYLAFYPLLGHCNKNNQVEIIEPLFFHSIIEVNIMSDNEHLFSISGDYF